MTGQVVDVAADMRSAVVAEMPGHAASLEVEDLWETCSLLGEAGLLETDDRGLGLIRRGPFRLAKTKYTQSVVDFVDVLLPLGIVAAVTHGYAVVALTAAARSVAKLFIEVLRHGVVFGREDADRSRWAVLVCVHELTDEVGGATSDEIAQRLGMDSETVERSLAWLGSAPALGTKEPQALVRQEDNGRYVSFL